MNYYDVNAWNASAIKQGARSMLHLEHYLRHGIKATSAMNTGTMMHMALLEPERLDALVVYDGDKRKKEYKALVAENGKENIITLAEKQAYKTAAKMVKDHPVVAVEGFFEYGVSEAEFFWEESVGACKAKIDWLREDYWIEYKTTQSLSNFISTAVRMNYQLQLGWYWKAAGQKPCFIIAQESSAPYDVAVYSVPEYELESWSGKCIEIIERYNTGIIDGAYPGIMHFELPKWAEDEEPILEMGE